MKLFMRVSVMILFLSGMLFASTAAPVRALSGGPDGFDYSFVDSVDPGPNAEKPVYNLEDISASGTPITGLGDAGISAPLDLGFSFRYYGVSYDRVYVCVNGLLTFVSPGSDCPYPDAGGLPNTGNPNATVAGWWGDLDLTHSGAVYYTTLGTAPDRYFVVEFLAVPHFDLTWTIASLPLDPVTFEFKLYEGTNNIELHYQKAVASTLNEGQGPVNHSAGIENAAGTIGLQYYFGTGSLATPLAVRYYYNDTTPPTINITSRPANPTSDPVGVFNFTVSDTGGSGLGAVTCQLDGAGFNPCSDTFTTPSLGNGSHTFEINALDGASNPGSASYTWLVDTIAPSTSITANPTNPSASASADFSFTGSDAGSGVNHFECQLDGGGFATCTNPQHYPTLLDGLHTFEVQAVDAAGNTDPSPASFTWRVDTVAPTTRITGGPSDPSGSASATFIFDGVDAGGSGINHFECQLDSGGFSTCFSPKNLTSLADGSHTFQVRAVDNAGNTDATPATTTWTVDTIAPDTNFTNTPTNPSGSSASFSFTGSDSTSGVALLECKLDAASFATCTIPQNLTSLADGSHTFQVRAVDNVGNIDATPASYTWTVDAIAPDTSFTSTPSNPSASSSASFSFSGSDPGGSGVARLECKLDAASFATCTSPRNLTSLADGSHTFQVRAVDNVGNIDPTPDSYTWLVDTTAPDTSFITTPTNPSGSASASFSLSGSDAGSGVARLECKLDLASFATCTSPQNLTSLADGSHTFQVRTVDNVGNIDATPASYTWVVDTATPTVTINTKPADPTNVTTGSFTFTANGTGSAVSAISCKLDGGSYADCISGSVSYPGLADGSHTFSVYATDAAGNNGSASPASYTWTVNTAAPAVPLLVSPLDSALTIQTSLTLTWQASNGATGYLLILDGGAPLDLGNVTSYVTPVLGKGPHTWSVAAYDAAGNISAYAANFKFTVGWPVFLPTVRK